MNATEKAAQTFSSELDRIVDNALACERPPFAHMIYSLDMMHARVQSILIAKERMAQIQQQAAAIKPATQMPNTPPPNGHPR